MAFEKFPAVFVRLTGRGGGVREFRALVDPGAEYCVIPKVDAFLMGYSEIANDDPIGQTNNTVTFTGYNGYGKALLVVMAQVELGTLSLKNVDFLALDLPQVTGFDVILGRSLLQFMKLELDYPAALLRIEKGTGGLKQ